jgi:sortase B
MKRRLLMVVCLTVMAYCATEVFKYFYDYMKVSKELDDIQFVEAMSSIDEMKIDNEDIIGWLSLEGTRLDNPVLQTTDNEFYLTHNYLKEESRGGSIFLDYRNLQLGHQHSILYGHVLRNGTMFGDLHKFTDQVYADEHPTFIFETEHEYYELQVFSAYNTTTDNYYLQTKFTDDQFKNFLQTIVNRSVIQMPVAVTTADRIVTLSTCTTSLNDKERFVVHAKVVQRKK